MALITCKECAKEISDTAVTCPHCGAETLHGKTAGKKARNAKRSNVQGAGCLVILLAIILGFTVLGAPFAVILGIIGLVILVIGLFS